MGSIFYIDPSLSLRGTQSLPDPLPLIRTPRTLPRVVSTPDVDALLGTLRTRRDRAMVEAMLFGELCRRVRITANSYSRIWLYDFARNAESAESTLKNGRQPAGFAVPRQLPRGSEPR